MRHPFLFALTVLSCLLAYRFGGHPAGIAAVLVCGILALVLAVVLALAPIAAGAQDDTAPVPARAACPDPACACAGDCRIVTERHATGDALRRMVRDGDTGCWIAPPCHGDGR